MAPLRDLRDAAVFVPSYIALDWASYIAPFGAFNITPWNPQPALAIAWMLLAGFRLVPVLFVTIFAAEVLVRHAPAGIPITLLTALVLALGYAAIAGVLRASRRLDPRLRTTHDLTVLATVALVGTGLVGAAFVGVLGGAGLLAAETFSHAWLRFWLGDAVGVLVTAPLFLVAADAERRHGLLALARRPETLVQVVALIATCWLIFEGLGGDPLRHFYLLFLPLIWIASRGGMNGAVVAAALVQLGVVIGIHRESGAQLPVFELQALVAALTLTALFLGMVVDERERAAEDLKHSLRLAAAGEMAGAIAHEVNQPLTALSTYGQAALLVAGRGGEGNRELAAIVERMLAESERAAEIVRRLRDFFRSGTTRLELVPAADLAASARRIGHQLAGDGAVTIDVRCEEALPSALVDRMQIELVLRNVIANAVDAVQARPAAQPRIEVEIRRHDADHLLLTVLDSGPGVSAGQRESIFEPFVSGKSTGMGLGLAVSRAIAEAHGGSLEARAGAHGEFHLVLPLPSADG
ncbi:MAG: GHKL domain-containing protein [Thermoanaerobaculia bacterium]|nr:MAG: GHKL domain-containing protein [Thermoanaerobaculia bacterium]